MSKEKQIEEMAKDLRALDCLQYNPKYSIEYQRATGLYALGYRKTSEVAREIFEEIEFVNGAKLNTEIRCFASRSIPKSMTHSKRNTCLRRQINEFR